jgi:L-alanine-DL-glutamate epimerase-like enolase superfamily enzyme
VTRRLQIRSEAWPIRGSFRIARGAKSEAEVVVVEISQDDAIGRGECVPYPRYGESSDSVCAELACVPSDVSRADAQRLLPAGAARNALDCALLDLEAKQSGRRVHEILGLPAPHPAHTAFTISVDTPQKMGAAAADAARRGYTLLKLKLAGPGDEDRVAAVRTAAPSAALIVDANEGWTEKDLDLIGPLGRLGVALIEQPLPAGRDDALQGFISPVPLCADESCHTRKDLPRLAGRYSHLNVKLDKAGGLTEASALAREAKDSGFGLMIGCMVSTSLAVAPATLLAPLADFVDLDGPLLLARDREPGLRYENDLLFPLSPLLWG